MSEFEKRVNCAFSEYVSGTIAAINFKPGMNILSSSYYTCCNLQAPPISGMGGASGHVGRL